MRRLIAAIVLAFWGLSAVADNPKPKDQMEALMLLFDAISKSAPEANPVVDDAEMSIELTDASGMKLIYHADNLYIQMSNTTSQSERQGILDRTVKVLLQSLTADLPAFATDRVYPILRPEGFVTAEMMADLPSRPFPGALREFWVMDTPDAIVSVNKSQLEAAGMSLEHLDQIGIDNLMKRLVEAQFQTADGIQYVRLDGTYESSLVFLPTLWRHLDEQMGRVAVLVLARDILVIADADLPSQLTILRGLADEHYAAMDHPVSSDVFLWDGEGWTVLTE